jgi:chemotaxis protein histidine kinase CheA
MSNSPEPVLDMSEIISLYKGDARKMVEEMRASLQRWDDLCAGGTARQTLRKISHQLRGSGRTYGFHSVSRVGKAIERVIQRLESRALQPDDRVRQSLANKVERLASIFKE